MEENKKRKISLGFLKPSRLEGDTIYIQLECHGNGSGGPDYVNCYATSNIPFYPSLYGAFSSETELVKEDWISGHSPNRYRQGEEKLFEYQKDLEKFAKINNIEIIENRFEYEGLVLIKELGRIRASFSGIQSSANSNIKHIEDLLK